VVYGILAMCLAVFIHALSTVLVKRWHGELSSMTVTTGGMLVAAPAYLITWIIVDGHWPATIPDHAVWSIIYLAVIATTVGFNLYYYILKHMQASKVALLTLLTPVLALWIGSAFNQELISESAWLGTSFILGGMSLYQWGALWMQRFKARWRPIQQPPDV
jgi:drug/metabolite transporter (DMT)-like permease